MPILPEARYVVDGKLVTCDSSQITARWPDVKVARVRDNV
jgi:hypothetical protein